jgi:DNA invertase Pin-like site-specific DNA recombinase
MPNTNGHAPKPAVLYARVSSDEQARHGYSLDQQIGALPRVGRPRRLRGTRRDTRRRLERGVP